MVPFTDAPKCPKCGSGEVGMTWRAGGIDERDPDFLSIMCRGCGHSWHMEPRDRHIEHAMESLCEQYRKPTPQWKIQMRSADGSWHDSPVVLGWRWRDAQDASTLAVSLEREVSKPAGVEYRAVESED